MSTRLRPVLVSLILVLPWAAAAQRPMTFDDVLSYKAVSSPAISPDGQVVVFVVREADLEKNAFTEQLWRYDAASGSSRRITFTGARNRAPRWAPDGLAVAFLSDRAERTQIYLMPREGGEARPVTRHATPVQSFRWSPDGRSIAFTAVDAKSDETRKAEEAGEDAVVVEARFDWPKLWVVDVETGEARQIVTDDVNVEEYAWSPDGARFALRVRPTTLFDWSRQSEIHVMPAGGGPLTRLTDNDTAESGLLWSADGRALLYTAADEARFINAEPKLFRIDVASREIQRLAASYEHGIDDLAWEPGGGRLLFLSGVGASQRLSALDVETGAITTLTRTDGTVTGFDVAGAGMVAFVFTDAAHLPDLWWGRLAPFDAKATPAINAQAANWQLGDTRVVRWTSTDGWEIEGLLTLPVGYQPGRRYPLMVVLHGGPHAAVTRAFAPNYIDYHQLLAGRGWAVLRPNYRGGSNYGDRFAQGMNGDTGGGDFRDIMTGVDHVIAQGIADADRLGVMGWSWGGISTGWIVTQTDRFKAASAGAMVSNHFSVFGEADLTYDVEYFYVGGTPWADPGRYLSMSPIGHVMKARTPTLLLHGQEDVRCPFPQSMEFYRGLKAAGVETQLVAYPREPHVFREPKHQLDKMQRETAWFERHVTGPGETGRR